MPENLHDTPARLEQHNTYLKDPTNPEGKPYSSKQAAANQMHKTKVTLYHAIHGTHTFDADECIPAMADGWRDTPYVHPNNPDHQPPVDETAEDNEIEALRAELTNMGRKFDKRWGKERLRQELLKPDG